MNRIKSFLKYNLFGTFSNWVYQRKTFDKNSVTSWIKRYTRNKRMDVVQIGSNDGVSGDPLHALIKENTKWRVVFVEPIVYLFDKLKQNYGPEGRFIFENTAINDGSDQIFYWVDEDVEKFIPDLPKWHNQLGSFDKNNILKHLDGKLAPYIIESNIKGINIDNLMLKHNVNRLGVLHIDAEGYDWKILSQLNLSKHSPSIILFEHKHLETSEKIEATFFLNSRYHIFQFGGDYLCVEKKVFKRSDLKNLGKQVKIITPTS